MEIQNTFQVFPEWGLGPMVPGTLLLSYPSAARFLPIKEEKTAAIRESCKKGAMMKADEVIRKELLVLLSNGNAHSPLEEVLDRFPMARINERAPHMPYAPWQILEHLRRTQRDIIAFIQDPDYESPSWPEGYFPAPSETTDAAGWQRILSDFLSDRAILEEMVQDRTIDLFEPLAHAPGYTIFREILTAADHNAYHTGELAVMRQVMKSWPRGKELYDASG